MMIRVFAAALLLVPSLTLPHFTFKSGTISADEEGNIVIVVIDSNEKEEGSGWDNSVEPPLLIDPLQIELSSNYTKTRIEDFDRVGCEGDIYRVAVPDGRDAVVTAAGVIQYPVYITGGRNVIVRGVEVRPVIQPGCDVGEAHQVKNTIPNIHPRLPGGKAFRFEQSHHTFVEGVDIDLMGMEADCFVLRNRKLTKEKAIQQREMSIVNTRCTGIEGLDDSPIGDGIHGDFFQNQGRDNMKNFTLENVTFLTSSNGVTLHNWSGDKYRPRLFRMRNVNYGWDDRYSNDDAYEINGLAFTGHGDRGDFENVWLNHNNPRYNYGFFNGERVGAFSSGNVKKQPGIYGGPRSDFAPADRTGVEYEN